MTALIVGIVAAVFTVLSWFGVPYVGFIGIICGIVAWVMGNNAVKADPSDTQAKIGKILGIIVTILAIISFILLTFIIGAAIGTMAAVS